MTLYIYDGIKSENLHPGFVVYAYARLATP